MQSRAFLIMCEPNARRALEGSASVFYVPGKLQVRLKVRILRRLVAVFRLRPGCLGGVINISELAGAAAIRTVELLRK